MRTRWFAKDGNRRCRRWLLIGHYGGSNTGDDAMLAGLIDEIRRHAHAQTEIFVVAKDVTIQSVLPKSVRVLRPHPVDVIRGVIASDVVVLGGGTHFHDDYRGLRFLRHLRYMLRIVAVCGIAKILGRKVLWLGMGFGPFHRWISRLVLKIGVATTDLITVRDSRSLREVGRWTDHDNVILGFDLAALLFVEPPGHWREERETKRRCLGLSVSSVARGRLEHNCSDQQYWQVVGDAIANVLKASPDVEVLIFVFRGGDREDDRQLSKWMSERLAAIDRRRVSLIPYNADPRVTIAAIRECRWFLATRFHAALLAYLAECELMIVPYHRKLEDLCRDIKLPKDACLPIANDITTEQVEKNIRELLTGSPKHRPGVSPEVMIKDTEIISEIIEACANGRKWPVGMRRSNAVEAYTERHIHA